MHHIDPADALETSGDLAYRLEIYGKHSLVDGPSDGKIGDMAFHSSRRMDALGFASRLTSVQQMNMFPVYILQENLAFCLSRKPVS